MPPATPASVQVADAETEAQEGKSTHPGSGSPAPALSFRIVPTVHSLSLSDSFLQCFPRPFSSASCFPALRCHRSSDGCPQTLEGEGTMTIQAWLVPGWFRWWPVSMLPLHTFPTRGPPLPPRPADSNAGHSSALGALGKLPKHMGRSRLSPVKGHVQNFPQSMCVPTGLSLPVQEAHAAEPPWVPGATYPGALLPSHLLCTLTPCISLLSPREGLLPRK